MMKRRDFLGAVAAGAAGAFVARPRFPTPSPAPASQWFSTPAQRGTALDASTARQRLSEHRIATIELRTMQDRYPRTLGRNAQRGAHGQGGSREVRVVTTDQGVAGFGMAHVEDEVARRFAGARLSDLFDLETGTDDEAMPLDKPLNDLAGRVLGVPVYALLGAKGPARVPIYSGAIYLDDLDPETNPRGVPAVLDCCRQDYEAGYRAFKLKIGRGNKWMPRAEGIQRDIDVTRAVRQRFPDCKILVDANDGYQPNDFLGYLKAVADCGLYMIEEPFPEEREALLKLHEAMDSLGCKALIVEGEGRSDQAETPWRWGGYSQRHVDRLFALASEKLVNVINLDLDIVGFTRWRRAMPELVKAGVLASPHTWGGTARPFYTAHLAAGVGNVVIVEGVPGQVQGMDYSAFRFENGDLAVPDKPGFGLELNDTTKGAPS